MGTGAESPGTGVGFNELLLGAVLVLMIAGIGLGVSLYVLPTEHLEIPELQPVIRVARESDLPVGASRIIRWGERVILVVRPGEQQYFALQGTASSDGCVLRWDRDASRIFSPCSYVVYDLHGNVVTGLTTQPLQRYPVLIRGGIVYVGGA